MGRLNDRLHVGLQRSVDSQCQRIGGIIGCGRGVEAEETLNHALDLNFVGFSVTGNCGFERKGSGLNDGDIMLFKYAEDHTAGVRNIQSGTGISRKKEFFHHGKMRIIFLQVCG